MRITTWLQIVKRSNEGIEICIDYHWDLFADALDYRVPLVHALADVRAMMAGYRACREANKEHLI